MGIVFVNYNSSRLLIDCIKSLVPDLGRCPIVVVDNNSTSDQKEALRSGIDELLVAETSPVVIWNSDNRGFGAAVNQGADRLLQDSAPEYLWILNPDTVAIGRPLTTLIKEAVTHTWDIATPLLIVPRGNGVSQIWFSRGELRPVSGESRHIDFKKPIDLESAKADGVPMTFCTGAAMLVRSDCWHDLGGLREDLFLYWEDAEFSLRARESGYRIGSIPKAQMIHHQGGSSDKSGLSSTFCYYYHRNRLILFGSSTIRKIDLLAGRGGYVTWKPILKAALLGDSNAVRACFRGIRDGWVGRLGPEKSQKNAGSGMEVDR
ncbi:glycosyltransferase family 2 protein [Gordonia amicalis]